MGEERVFWFCTYTPLELLQAAGLEPVRLFGLPERAEASDALLHPALCPYLRACLSQAMEEEGDHHAVFVNSCDGMRRFHDAWKDLFPGAFVFFMDLPRNEGETGKRMLAGEYRLLLSALRSFRGAEVTAQDVINACEARERLRQRYLSAAEGKSGAARLALAQHFQSRPRGAAAPTRGGRRRPRAPHREPPQPRGGGLHPRGSGGEGRLG